MKKSKTILLSSVFFVAISSCGNEHKDEWTDGKDATGKVHDTSVFQNGVYHYYRYYGTGWYILNRNNMINVGEVAPSSAADISSARSESGGVHTGGFGSSAHGGAGE